MDACCVASWLVVGLGQTVKRNNDNVSSHIVFNAIRRCLNRLQIHMSSDSSDEDDRKAAVITASPIGRSLIASTQKL